MARNMPTPTLINVPPPPSNPDTPSDMGPGTPNSGTTSLSAISTTAIKDGHGGHASSHVAGHASQQSTSASRTNTLDAERADRISRLAGLERVATVRAASASGPQVSSGATQPPGYFDSVNPQIRERSTVGSASATGSVGGRTTWASSSDMNDGDKISEDHDDGVSSSTGLSDEGNASLVGFGEGASSTISGPVSTASRLPTRQAGMGSPGVPKGATLPSYVQQQGNTVPGSSHLVPTNKSMAAASAVDQRRDAQSIDGMTYDADIVDTVNRPQMDVDEEMSVTPPAEMAERIVRERLDEGEQTARALGSPEVQNDGRQGLGKFYFETK